MNRDTEGLGAKGALLAPGSREDQLDNALACLELLGELTGGLLSVHIFHRPQKSGEDVVVVCLKHAWVMQYKSYQAPTLLEALQKARDAYDPEWHAKARATRDRIHKAISGATPDR